MLMVQDVHVFGMSFVFGQFFLISLAITTFRVFTTGTTRATIADMPNIVDFFKHKTEKHFQGQLTLQQLLHKQAAARKLLFKTHVVLQQYLKRTEEIA